MDDFSASRGSSPTLPYLRRPIPERIKDVQQAIEAYADHKDLREALADKNVRQDRIDALDALLQPVLAALTAQTAADVAQGKTRAAQPVAVAEAERTYAVVADIGNAAFRKNPAARTALALGARKDRQTDRFDQMRTLYDGAPAYDAELTDYGLKPDDLADARRALAAAELAVRDADRRDAEAQDATDARDLPLAPLDAAFRDFLERAETALKGRPQLLELLGLRPR